MKQEQSSPRLESAGYPSLTISEFKQWVATDPIRGHGKIMGRWIDQSPVGTYIEHLTHKVCRVLADDPTSPFPTYSTYHLGVFEGDSLNKLDASQPLPEWAVRLHGMLIDNFGSSSRQAEWFFSGEDTLRLVTQIENSPE